VLRAGHPHNRGLEPIGAGQGNPNDDEHEYKLMITSYEILMEQNEYIFTYIASQGRKERGDIRYIAVWR